MQDKRVKSIITSTYQVELYEKGDGFEILYDSYTTGLKKSEVIKDYIIADLLFDMKVQELEGH